MCLREGDRIEAALDCLIEFTRELQWELVSQALSLIAALAQSEEAAQTQLQVHVMQPESNSAPNCKQVTVKEIDTNRGDQWQKKPLLIPWLQGIWNRSGLTMCGEKFDG